MFVKVRDIVVHVQVEGPEAAPALLMLHSLGTNLHIWDPQAERLSLDWRVIRPDIRGHGLTEAPDGPYTLEGLADDVVALLDRLEIDTVHVAGISIGGMVAQKLAAKVGSRVSSLMLCDTSMRVAPPDLWHRRAASVRAHGMASIADDVVGRWFTDAFKDHVAARGARTMLLRTAAEGYAGGAEALALGDCRDTTGLLRCPTMVLVGDQDLATPVTSATAIHQAIVGSQLVIIPGAAHISSIEQPKAVTDALMSFLKTLP